MAIDYNEILHSNPKKNLMIGFENLKKNFTESEALTYSETYKNQPLSFILENARYIFSDPYVGYDFYKGIIEDSQNYCMFTEYETQKDIIDNYIKENGELMEDHQKAMYEDLSKLITEKCNDYRNTITMSGFALEKAMNDAWVSEFIDTMYECNKTEYKDLSKVEMLLEKVDDAYTYFTYVPYVSVFTESLVTNNDQLGKFFTEHTSSELENIKNFKPFVEDVVILNKLKNDTPYMESVSHMKPRSVREVISTLMEEDVHSYVENIVTEKVNDINTYYSTPFGAVNSIFEDNFLYKVNKEDNELSKQRKFDMQSAIYESVFDLVNYEYTHELNDENKVTVSGYGSLFSEGTTLDDAFAKITSLKDEFTVVTESKDDDEDVQLKKVEAPKAKNLATKIQVDSMNREAKSTAKRAVRKQKGQEIKNAAKATLAVPINYIKDFQKEAQSLDEMDDARRAKYIIKPGFRKKAFKKLKLALMYGTAAQISLLYVPFTMVLRHFSKMKDKRIRNELIHDLNTEIKICDAKIDDANANGDRDKKYQLMRIRAELEKEATRVTTNSKYI